MTELQASFLSELIRAGVAPHNPDFIPLPTSRILRFRIAGQKGKAGWYVFHPKGFAFFGDWHAPEHKHRWVWDKNGAPDEAEIAKYLAKVDEQLEAERVKAAEQLEDLLPTLQSASPRSEEERCYFRDKNIDPLGEAKDIVDQGRPAILLPLRDETGKLHSAQLVYHSPLPAPEGEKPKRKLFFRGGRTQGCFFAIGAIDPKGPLLLCEGYATGCTLASLSELPVACAMYAGNMSAVAKALLGRYPQIQLVVCPDDDWETPVNAGMKAADAVRKAFPETSVLPPAFSVRDHGDSDWNDLAAKNLKDARIQLESLKHDYRRYPPIRAYDRARAESLPAPQVAIEGLLRRGNTMCLVGGSKLAKTWCLLDLAAAVSHTDKTWLGRDIVAKGNVLYVNFELDQDDMDERILQIQRNLHPDAQIHRIDCWNLKGVDINAQSLLDELRRLVVAGEYAFIIVDPLYCLLGEAQENDSGDIARIMRYLQRISATLQTTLVFVDHTVKGDVSDRDVIDLMSGSSVKGRAIDAVVAARKHRVWDIESPVFVVEAVVRHFAPSKPLTVRFDFPSWIVDHDTEPELKTPKSKKNDNDDKSEAKLRRLVEIVETTEQSGAIVKELEKSFGVSERSARAILADGAAKNYVFAHKAGKYHVTSEGTSFWEGF